MFTFSSNKHLPYVLSDKTATSSGKFFNKTRIDLLGYSIQKVLSIFGIRFRISKTEFFNSTLYAKFKERSKHFRDGYQNE